MQFDIRYNLKSVIEDKGYIQAAIAKKANIAPCKLSQVLNGKRKLDANELFNLCGAIEMTPVELKEYSRKGNKDEITCKETA